MFWLIQVAIVREYPQRSCFVENIYIYIYNIVKGQGKNVHSRKITISLH